MAKRIQKNQKQNNNYPGHIQVGYAIEYIISKYEEYLKKGESDK